MSVNCRIFFCITLMAFLLSGLWACSASAVRIETWDEYQELFTSYLESGDDTGMAELVNDNPFFSDEFADYFRGLAAEEPENKENWLILASLIEAYLNGEHPMLHAELEPEQPDLPCASIYEQGVLEKNAGNYVQALDTFGRARECVLEISGGVETADTAELYNEMGLSYQFSGNFDSAVENYQKALEIFRGVYGDTHYNVARSYSNIGYASYSTGDFDRTLESFRKALEILEELYGPENADSIMIYTGIGEVKRSMGDYETAVELLNRALQLDRKLKAEEDAETAIIYNNIGAVISDEGDYERAVEYYRKALDINIKINGENHPDTAVRYNNLASLQAEMGDFAGALESFRKTLEIFTDTLGGNHPYVATVYNNIGDINRNLGRYPEALEASRKALEISTAASGADSLESATSYNNIGAVYGTMGNLDAALENYEKAYRIFLEHFGENHETSATALNNIGTIYSMKGDYASALEYQKKSLDILLAVFGENHPRVMTAYNNMGTNYISLGVLGKAEECFEHSLKIGINLYGDNHLYIAQAMNNIGAVYDEIGEFQKAEESYLKSLEIRRKALGENHPDTIQSYNNLGYLFHEQGDYGKADEYYSRSLELSEQFFGKNHPKTAVTYNNRGVMYNAMEDYGKAVESHGRALAAMCGGNPDPEPTGCLAGEETVKGFLMKAEALFKNEEFDRSAGAFENAAEALELMRGEIVSEDAKKFHGSEYFNMFPEGIAAFVALAEETGDAGELERAFNFAEKGIGRVFLQMLGNRVASVKGGLPDEVINEWMELYAVWVWANSDAEAEEDKPKEQRTQKATREAYEKLNKAAELLGKFEEELFEKYPGYAELMNPGTKSLEVIRKDVIGPDEAVLEYYLGKDQSFLVFLTKTGLDVIELPPAENIGNLVDLFRKKITTRVYNESSFMRTSEKMTEVLLSPVIDRLADMKRLIIVPTGKLYFIPFEALAVETGGRKGFLADMFDVMYAPSLNVLYMVENRADSGRDWDRDWLGFGDPVYGENDPRAGGQTIAESTGEMVQGYTRALGTDPERGFAWQRIPGTGVEIDEIRSLFEKEEKLVEAKTGLESNEWDFKYAMQLEAPRYLHVASHGTLGEGGALQPALVFSLLGNRAGEDGFLTMSEVFDMRVPSEMVVLSACKTGSGKMEKGEGVAGMARAFLYAGADSVVVSLWSVADEQTKDFMISFYGRLLDGQDRASAFADTKREMIKQGLSPYYWAPFVYIGKN